MRLLVLAIWPGMLFSEITFGGRALAVPEQQVPSDEQGRLPGSDQPDEINGPLQQRQRRLEVHLKLFQQWLQRNCDLAAEQQLALKRLCDEELRLSQASWENDPNSKPQWLVPDFAPIEFTNTAGAASFLLRPRFCQQLQQLLTADQESELAAQEAVRLDRLKSEDINYHLAMIDQELQLSERQWVEMEWWLTTLYRITSSRQAENSRLFSLKMTAGPLRMGSHSMGYHRLILNRVKDLELTVDQRHRMERLPNAVVQPAPLTFTYSVSDESFETELAKAFSEFKEQTASAMESAVLKMQSEWQLSDDQVSHLRLAGRGAAIKYLEQWKMTNAEAVRKVAAQREQMQRVVKVQAAHIQEQQLLAHRARGPGDHVRIDFAPVDFRAAIRLSARLPGLNQSEVLSQPVWVRALESLRPEEDFINDVNKERRRQAIAGFVVSTLDRELWLLDEQREQLALLVAESLPDAMDRLRDPGRELVWLAMPLLRIERERIEQILDEAQLTAWDLLRQQYHVQDGKLGVTLTSGTQFRTAIPD